ncbi:glutamine-dependent NAD(+) synthetase [Clostridium pasteurianum DSM 525 = ATCC 6013]|uniref:Glutamine-dependent NAD(+) synthetase n=1 Tax=Clostridium pasteurianum DSM 525 = ATCC 6013 TaxID=1262449 RepID=A0A0H3J490_CLOPA|nr:NAD(+) synthase [Clostridium pasteurianum]AJA47687.1 glutamine-dependent NAD(+) synthetase [Clostridium pasteurianum DSM 525 = ATCC 6013]AJA51675.1 glutamine-dependent NAD(+) synthetase [Clostridium pasteurianum DSM 525 = ATCC 6013]AOZ74991.1 NAD synthetase [Clostridium pasteurianum DSM 525 = ATCC 6013]AOZ78786.1 NAD synthetase [Clostridium pasteurianum]ELP59590.1 NAD synthetase [Clostridium pasteurianum DSM 525 = ATCC 6013]
MVNSFIKVSSACPKTKVSDIDFNIENIKICIMKALEDHSKVIIFPELSITSYTCSDLFYQQQLIDKSYNAIEELCSFSYEKDILIVVGSILIYRYCTYNCAFVIFNGKILGIVPKSYIPNYTEFYEKRWFTEGLGIIDKSIDLPFQSDIPFGTNLIFSSNKLQLGIEICEDLWVTIPPSSYLSLLGANVIGNLSASNEVVSKADYRRSLVSNQSARCMSAYIYSSSGVYESSTDLLFSGDLIISENGSILKSNERFQRENEVITSIIDLDKLNMDRIKNVSFRDSVKLCTFTPKIIDFKYTDISLGEFNRPIDKYPFVPANESLRHIRCKEIFNIQTAALAKRIEHTGLKKAVIGISGGLDSTLALLVVIKTFDMLKLPRKNILTITMPGFGTTDRTYGNAINLCKNSNTDLREINIVDACLLHFKDIGHPVENHDVTYENVQARERTQILMDIANKEAGLLIGTGDLSELALGWCTYNGDHMSMYSVNCSIPKTLVRYLVKYVAEKEVDKATSEILLDILNTPVSPELLPKDKEGNISQKTEDLVGPYELHDFFLYYFIRQGASPEKILYLSNIAFKDVYDEKTIKKWLKKFLTRFFTQQFKRSAVPDGPKVGTVSLSPRGDWRMPSDASFNVWIDEIKE